MALMLIKRLKPIPEVFPTGRNSIQFEWETDDEILYLEMEIFDDNIKIFNEAQYQSKSSVIEYDIGCDCNGKQ